MRNGGFRVSYSFPRYTSRGCEGSICGRQGGEGLGSFHRRQEATYAELPGLPGRSSTAEEVPSNTGRRLRHRRRLRDAAGGGLRGRQRRRLRQDAEVRAEGQMGSKEGVCL